ncbi:hypothetical protein ES707_01310 [subsurface metagenome]
MFTIWQILKPEDKLKWARFYKELDGFEFIPPNSPSQTIQCETKLERLEEIDRLMRQKPNPTRRE